MSYRFKTVSVNVEIDVDDVLNEIDDNDLIDYLSDSAKNKLVKELYSEDPSQLINALHKQMCHMYGGVCANITKDDLKKNICEYIDDYFYTIKKN